MIRLLIAEDSETVQRVLVSLLENEPGIEIVGIANDGETAVEMCHTLHPDLVTMDIFMPKLNGVEATQRIMRESPTNIVIISSMVGNGDNYFEFEAMRAGAVQVIEKPTGLLSGQYQNIKKRLLSIISSSVKANPDAQMSWMPDAITSPRVRPESVLPPAVVKSEVDLAVFAPDIVCIGGSTGAPTVVLEILSRLGKNYPFPVVVGQHISRGFAPKMTQWLNTCVDITVELATRGSVPTPGKALVCPDDECLNFTSRHKLSFVPPENPDGHIPNLDMMFSTAAKVYGANAVGIILSGMGKDGSNGMLAMKQQGALTLSQDEATSVIWGMNRVATELGAVDMQLSPVEIGNFLYELASNV